MNMKLKMICSMRKNARSGFGSKGHIERPICEYER